MEYIYTIAVPVSFGKTYNQGVTDHYCFHVLVVRFLCLRTKGLSEPHERPCSFVSAETNL
jgi:hypothetical protein